MKLAVFFAALCTSLCFAADAKDDAVKEAKAKLKGSWEMVSGQQRGEKTPEDVKIQLVFDDDKIVINLAGKETEETTYTIDPTKKPAEITLVPTDGLEKGKKLRGIYALDKDELKLCIADNPETERPKEFATKEGHATTLLVLKREKK